MYFVAFIETDRKGDFEYQQTNVNGLRLYSIRPYIYGIHTFQQKPTHYELKVPVVIGNQSAYVYIQSDLALRGIYEFPVFLENGSKTNFMSYMDITLFSSSISNMHSLVENEFKNLLCIGHRGFGMNKVSYTLLENSIPSFNYASKHGADMIELDVQFTKDHIPVIWHDFTVKTAKPIPNEQPVSAENGVYEYAVYQLTFQQFVDWGMETTWKTPVPSLQQILTELPESIPIDVEIKSIFEEARLFNKVAFPERNMFLDAVLDVINQFIGSRKIIYSTFDPMTAIMLKHKQNKFPVYQLSCSDTFETDEIALRRLKSCINTHKEIGINGFVLDSELIYKFKDIPNEVFSNGYSLYTYGKLNYEEKTVREQISMGIKGICTDFCEPISKVVHSC